MLIKNLFPSNYFIHTRTIRILNRISSSHNQKRRCYAYLTRSYPKYEQLEKQNIFKVSFKPRTLPIFPPSVLNKCYCKGIIEEKITETESNKIKEIFPLPRVTLQNLNSKTPEPIFEIHYKQSVTSLKGVKKKAVQNDWICSYVFIWPEKRKFECTSISKRLAAEKSATQALHWLYSNKFIDKSGSPVYDEAKLRELQTTISNDIQASVNEKTLERLQIITNEYETDIKSIYETTFEMARQRAFSTTTVLTKDSTIDEDGVITEDDLIMETPEVISDVSEAKVHTHPVYGRPISPPSEATLRSRERFLQRKFEQYDDELTPLPIDQYADVITSTVASSRVSLIVGAPGCGKSTRAPPALLKACGARTACVVTEPRRVAAIGLAERVASELGEQVGDTVGYHVRLRSRPPRPPAGSLLYCTSGVLLRRLQTNPGLEGCTHVIVDEAHERDVNTDLILLLVKRALTLNPTLRLVIMSATLDTQVFTRYFDSCPVIEVPGRTYPVQLFYLDEVQRRLGINLPATVRNSSGDDARPQINCQEVAEVIKAVDKTQPEGAVLVFLPGWAEIAAVKQLLDQHYGGSGTHLILPVHSRLSTEEQARMFGRAPPGVRKLVLATNAAETAVTVPDAVCVVDTGAHRQAGLVAGTGAATLDMAWVSLASAKQRAGRAGRVQPGECFKLYTREREEMFQPHTTPEILRVPLEQTVLDCKTYAPDEKAEDFLSQLPEPPSKAAIQFAVDDLIDLGALTAQQRVTRLGVLLGCVTLPPRLGAALLRAAVAGCVTPVANSVAVCASNVEIFRGAADRREEIREIKRKRSATCDFTALNAIQQEFEERSAEGQGSASAYCDRLGLNLDRLKLVRSISSLHLEQVLKTPVVQPSPNAEELNRFAAIDELVSAILLSGTNSLLISKKKVDTRGKLKTKMHLFTSKGDRAHVGGSSVNHAVWARAAPPALLAHCGGLRSAERRALVVHACARVTPLAALLFCAGRVRGERQHDSTGDVTVVNMPRHKLKIHIPTSHEELLQKAREMLWRSFDYYIERDVMNLDYEEDVKVTNFKNKLIKTICRILVEADREYVQLKSPVLEPNNSDMDLS